LLLKLAEVGVVAIFSYGVFIIYIFFSNIQSTTFEQHKSEITYFTFNISEPAGQFALAFMIHNAIGTFTSCNRVKENNSRDLSISYFLAGLIYGMVGVLGAIGIVVANHTLILIG
jgi:sodium-coupled neutral amino acid transporter 9